MATMTPVLCTLVMFLLFVSGSCTGYLTFPAKTYSQRSSGSVLTTITCPMGTIIVVTSATYGGTSVRSACPRVPVTKMVSDYCTAEANGPTGGMGTMCCYQAMTFPMLADPCPMHKSGTSFVVKWKCGTDTMGSMGMPKDMMPMTMEPMAMTPMAMGPMTEAPMTMEPMTMTPAVMEPMTMEPMTETPMMMKPPPAVVAHKPVTLASVNWAYSSKAYATVHAGCGDKLPFVWSGLHNLLQVASASCSASVITQLAADESSPYTYDVQLPMTSETTHYLCSVGTHCSSGFMLISVITTCP